MSLITLRGENVRVVLNEDLCLTVQRRDGTLLWESSRALPPTAILRRGSGAPQAIPLSAAADISMSARENTSHPGHVVRLAGFEGKDVVVDLILGMDAASDELLIEIGQAGGEDTLVGVEHLYRFEKPVDDVGCMVLPHGSGYLIPADCPDALPGQGPDGGFIGTRWTLPLFGMVRGKDALCAIVETWWDCDVKADHVPGDYSALDFNWAPSLGEFAYQRRMLIRFAQGMDYVGMAKLYRDHAREQGLVRTLEEKAQTTPIIRQYVNNILFRWAAWNPDEGPAVLADIRALHEAGLGINFFYPKWSSAGYAQERDTATTANSGWQAFLHPTPVPGGWPTLVKLENDVHDLDCVVQGFVNPITQEPQGVQYDEDRWPVSAEGERQQHPISSHDALDRMKLVFDTLEQAGLKLDVLYYDSFSANSGLPQDFAPSHPMTRRQNIEAEVACFAETRRRGVMPGAELARFWAISACDYFFFTDWSADRLANAPNQHCPGPVGVPVPLFQLVFHDCFIAGFSGGGYAAYAGGYDWWDHRTPRLYELLYASAPAYNWLPEHSVPIADWDSDHTQRKLAWLKQWSAYYRAIATSELVSHQFLSPDRTMQRLEFENGIAAELDMAENRFRIDGLKGFSGDWETPPNL